MNEALKATLTDGLACDTFGRSARPTKHRANGRMGHELMADIITESLEPQPVGFKSYVVG